MNCTELDHALVQGQTLVANTTEGFVALTGTIGIVSTILIVTGERVARPLSSVLAAGTGSVGMFMLTELTDIECEPRLIVSAVAGGTLALLAWCLLAGGLFVLGGVAFGAVAHFLYHSIPWLSNLESQLVLFGNSIYYFAIVGGVGLIGAILSACYRKQLLRVTTSLVGGGGMSIVVYLVSTRLGHAPPSLVLACVLLSSSIMGVVIQTRLERYLLRRKQKKRAVQTPDA